MIYAKIYFNDATFLEVETTSTVKYGDSFLNLASIHLSMIAVKHTSNLMIFAYETAVCDSIIEEALSQMRPGPVQEVSAERYENLYHLAIQWSLDFHIIEFTLKPEPTFRIRAGNGTSVPVYLFSNRDYILIDWNYIRIIKSENFPAGLNRQRIAYDLMGKSLYTAQTHFYGLNQLTERATAIISQECSSVTYPDAAFQPEPLELRKDIDPYRLMKSQLARVFERRNLDSNILTVELSGGIDSSSITSVMYDVFGKGFNSVGIIYPGSSGKRQTSRREVIRRSFKLKDHYINCDDNSISIIFDENGEVRPELMLDFYWDLFNKVWLKAVAEGSTALVSGLGGDESCMLVTDYVTLSTYATEHKNAGYFDILTSEVLHASRSSFIGEAPSPPIARSLLISCANKGQAALRSGLWPINPFADLEVFSTIRLLDDSYRERKNIIRYLIPNNLLVEEFLSSFKNEDFAEFIVREVSCNALNIARTLSSGRLFKYGFIKPDSFEIILRYLSQDLDLAGVSFFMYVLSVEGLLGAAKL